MKKNLLGLLMVPCLAFAMGKEFSEKTFEAQQAAMDVMVREVPARATGLYFGWKYGLPILTSCRAILSMDEMATKHLLATEEDPFLDKKKATDEAIIRNIKGDNAGYQLVGWITGVAGAQERADQKSEQYKDFVLDTRNKLVMSSLGLDDLSLPSYRSSKK
jgi:hypothetical protein